LVDPPRRFHPEQLELVNKATIWQPKDGLGRTAGPAPAHLLIGIGREHYEHVADYTEEARLLGISRRLPGTFDVRQLTPGLSRMVLVHPRAFNDAWMDMSLATECKKSLDGHSQTEVLIADQEEDLFASAEGTLLRPEQRRTRQARRAIAQQVTAVTARAVAGSTGDGDAEPTREGPCLFKTYDLTPRDHGELALSAVDARGSGLPPRDVYARTIGSTTYTYTPTDEDPSDLAPGIFGVFPISGFALIRNEDGSVNPGAREKLAAGNWDFYESDE
jgi:hypothetical protein